jgi:hypothetical protein
VVHKENYTIERANSETLLKGHNGQAKEEVISNTYRRDVQELAQKSRKF